MTTTKPKSIPPHENEYVGTFIEKRREEDDRFGVDKDNNCTVEFILCWNSFPVKFEGHSEAHKSSEEAVKFIK